MITFTPSLLTPSRLINALSFGKRKSLGLSLPACGNGVTVPISTNPKPSVSSSLRYLAFLSKPAPRPIQFENSKFQVPDPKLPFGQKFEASSFLKKPTPQSTRMQFIEK